MRYALFLIVLGGLVRPLVAAEPKSPEVSNAESAPVVLSADEAQALLKQKLLELDALQAEIVTLRKQTRTPRQVVLQVQILEIDRTELAERNAELNLDLSALDAFRETVDHPSREITLAIGRPAQVVDEGDPLLELLTSLKKHRLAKVIAAPNLVTVSGRAAYFRAGGEIPWMTSDLKGKPLMWHKKVGTQVDFAPMVLGNNRLELNLRPRVAAIEEGREWEFQGHQVPALKVREMDMTIELESGQTAVVEICVTTDLQKEYKGSGILRTVRNRNHEIELLVVARPELVDEVAAPIEKTAKGHYTPRSR